MVSVCLIIAFSLRQLTNSLSRTKTIYPYSFKARIPYTCMNNNYYYANDLRKLKIDRKINIKAISTLLIIFIILNSALVILLGNL